MPKFTLLTFAHFYELWHFCEAAGAIAKIDLIKTTKNQTKLP